MRAKPVQRAFRYRFYPTEAQAVELTRTFGCVRTVYNLALTARAEAWTQRSQRVGYNATSAMLTAWKKTDELAYLREVSSVPLQQCLRHLHTAFGNFFARRANYPRFKSKKKSRGSAEYTASAFRWRNGELTLAKMDEPLRVVWSRPLPDGASPSTVTVSRDSACRWFVSILCTDVPAVPAAVDAAVGLDAGITALITLSTGEKIANPKHEQRDRARLARAQQALSRKAKGSRNRTKARLKVARVHARIVDRRRDYLHQLTTRLVRENQTLAIEDLAVRNMVKNHRLARAISDASWRELRSMLEYKASWYGRNLVVINRWFPSSKRCSACGTVRDRMPLHVREWACGCGAIHDRDVNAAKSILAAGLAVTACGDCVSPQRSTPGGQSSVKQEVVPTAAPVRRLSREAEGNPQLQSGEKVNSSAFPVTASG